jgi:hypothetical protein
MAVTIDGTNGVTTPGVVNTAAETIATTLAVTGVTTLQGLTVGRGAGAVATNTAVGASALAANQAGGTNNTAIGNAALDANTTGDANTAVGDDALGANTTASNNTAVGYQAGFSGTIAANNTFIGHSVGKNATTGSGNVMLGALNSSGTYSPLYDVTTGNDRVAIGTTSTTNAYVQVSWTVLSDARDKTNISNLNIGLNFVNKLNPVKYQFKKSREDETPHGNLRYGFLAQEILELEGNQPVIIDNEDLEKLRYTGEALIPVLVKAIQEQQATIVSLQDTLTALTTRITALEAA